MAKTAIRKSITIVFGEHFKFTAPEATIQMMEEYLVSLPVADDLGNNIYLVCPSLKGEIVKKLSELTN